MHQRRAVVASRGTPELYERYDRGLLTIDGNSSLSAYSGGVHARVAAATSRRRPTVGVSLVVAPNDRECRGEEETWPGRNKAISPKHRWIYILLSSRPLYGITVRPLSGLRDPAGTARRPRGSLLVAECRRFDFLSPSFSLFLSFSLPCTRGKYISL